MRAGGIVIHSVDVGRILGQVGEQRGRAVVRTVEGLDASSDIHLHLEHLEHVEVQVGPHVEALVTEVAGAVGIRRIQQAFVAEIVEVDVIAGGLGSTVEHYIRIRITAAAAEGLGVPVGVHPGAVAVGIKLGLAVDRRPYHPLVVGNGLIVESGEPVGIQRLVQKGRGLHSIADAGIHLRLPFHSPAGRDADDAVGALLAIECERCGILEHLHLLDFGGRDGSEIIYIHLEAVHEQAGLVPGSEAVATHSADEVAGSVAAGFAGAMEYGKAGEGPDEAVGEVGLHALVEFISGGCADRGGAVVLRGCAQSNQKGGGN